MIPSMEKPLKTPENQRKRGISLFLLMEGWIIPSLSGVLRFSKVFCFGFADIFSVKGQENPGLCTVFRKKRYIKKADRSYGQLFVKFLLVAFSVSRHQIQSQMLL